MEEESKSGSGADQIHGANTAHMPGATFHPDGLSPSIDSESESAAPEASNPMPAPEPAPPPAPALQPAKVVAHEPDTHPYKKRSLGKALAKELLLLLTLLVVIAVGAFAYIYFFKI